MVSFFFNFTQYTSLNDKCICRKGVQFIVGTHKTYIKEWVQLNSISEELTNPTADCNNTASPKKAAPDSRRKRSRDATKPYEILVDGGVMCDKSNSYAAEPGDRFHVSKSAFESIKKGLTLLRKSLFFNGSGGRIRTYDLWVMSELQTQPINPIYSMTYRE